MFDYLSCLSNREKEKLTYEIVDLKQRAQDITFLKVTRNIQEYLACSNDASFESQKQRELQMLEATIDKMKQVNRRVLLDLLYLFVCLLAFRGSTNNQRK
mgnify:FL=1